MDTPNFRNLQQSIVTGWIVLTVILTATMVVPLTQAAIATDFSEFVYHPGPAGLSLTCVLLASYALMAVVVQRCDEGWVRWMNLVLLVAATMVTLGHQISHFKAGQVHAPAPELLYLVHHVIGAWMILLAFRWAKVRRDRT